MTAVAAPRTDVARGAPEAAEPGAQLGPVRATPTADTEVFYMAGKQLASLARRLIAAGWPADAPASVVSRAGWPDQLHSDHRVATLAQASMLHAGRPTVVCVGAGARPLQRPIEGQPGVDMARAPESATDRQTRSP